MNTRDNTIIEIFTSNCLFSTLVFTLELLTKTKCEQFSSLTSINKLLDQVLKLK